MTHVINCSTLSLFFVQPCSMFLPPGGESFACSDSFRAPDLSVRPVLSRLQVVSATAAHSAHHHLHRTSLPLHSFTKAATCQCSGPLCPPQISNPRTCSYALRM